MDSAGLSGAKVDEAMEGKTIPDNPIGEASPSQSQGAQSAPFSLPLHEYQGTWSTGSYLPTEPEFSQSPLLSSTNEGIREAQGECRKIKGKRPKVAPPPPPPPNPAPIAQTNSTKFPTQPDATRLDPFQKSWYPSTGEGPFQDQSPQDQESPSIQQAGSTPVYHWDAGQRRYYQQYAAFNFTTRRWESEWMPLGFSPGLQQPSTNAVPEILLHQIYPGYYRTTYGSSPAGPARSYGSNICTQLTSQSMQTFDQQSGYQNLSSASPSKHDASPSIPGEFDAEYEMHKNIAVVGKFNMKLPSSEHNLIYEPVDASYFVRGREFFLEGRVFSVILSDNAGSTVTSYNSSLSEVMYEDQYVYTSVRRFVVVRQKQKFCFACPIFTYSGQATTKRGVRAEEHGIAYSWGQQPRLKHGEYGIVKAPIPVVMTDSGQPLDSASRIYYGVHHPILYNVRVKDVGYVPPDHIPRLIGNFKASDDTVTQQDQQITAEASIEPEKFGGIPRAGETDPHLYHAGTNPYGYHESLSPLTYHPTYNPYGYHPVSNRFGFHPQSNPYCYHPKNNPQGYHSQLSPYSYHPLYNEQGYHSQYNPYGFHPQSNPEFYHELANPYGYHQKNNTFGFHPTYNPYAYHPTNSPYGYHRHHNPTAYHQTHNPTGTYTQPSSVAQRKPSYSQQQSAISFQKAPIAYPKQGKGDNGEDCEEKFDEEIQLEDEENDPEVDALSRTFQNSLLHKAI